MIRALRNLHPLPAIITTDNLETGALNVSNDFRVHLVTVTVAFNDASIFDQIRPFIELL